MLLLRHAWKGEAMRYTALFAKRGLFCPGVETFTDAKKGPFALHAFKCATPYRDYVPAFVLPCLFVTLIAFDVLRPLLHPELHIALGHCRVGAAMTAMPLLLLLLHAVSQSSSGGLVDDTLDLKAGNHTFTLRMESDADNMDLEINDFKLRGYNLMKL